MKPHTYKDLIVWQKSIDLVINIYQVTQNFPKEELYGLTSQMRRAAISIPSNIAEGRLRGHPKEYRHFLLTAFGSGGELETQIEIVKQLPCINHLDFSKITILLSEIMKMLNTLISKLTILTPSA